MDHVISVGAKVLEYAVEPIAHQFGYLISHGGNVKELKDEFDKLEVHRDSIQLLVEVARRKDEEILPHVQKWLDEVDEMKKTVETFYEEENQAKTDCSLRACPNPWSLYRLSRKATKILTPKVIKLKGEGSFNPISCPKLPVPKWTGASSTSFSRGSEAFQSRISVMNMIMDALADPPINKIGLYGLGGAGKSTLAHDVAESAQKEKFKVVMVEVKQNPDYEKIQEEIGGMVGLQLDKESELIRAGSLCERLKQEKNLLVILDLWERLDLGKIGIPSAADKEENKRGVQLIPSAIDKEENKRGIQLIDDYKGCKIILISRSEEVLSSQMNCKKNIMLGDLTEKEAWELFKEMSEVK